jgi:hypothetical protein
MTPTPPQEISSDGREVWAWAERLSEHTQRLHRRREVNAAILEGETTCGSCSKWMTDACPREVQDNIRGMKRGPSCKSLKCGEFVMKRWDADRLEALKAELSQLNAAISGA